MTTRKILFAPLCLAATAVSLPAMADRPPREPSGMSWQQPARSRNELEASNSERYLRVRSQISLPAGPGCRYEGNVRGHIVAVMQNSPRQDPNPVRYRPRLAVRGQVVCGNAAPVQVAERTLDGGWVTGQRLEALLREQAGAAVRVHGGVCTYTPEFMLVRGHVVAESVQQSCAPGTSSVPNAWGGGPR